MARNTTPLSIIVALFETCTGTAVDYAIYRRRAGVLLSGAAEESTQGRGTLFLKVTSINLQLYRQISQLFSSSARPGVIEPHV